MFTICHEADITFIIKDYCQPVKNQILQKNKKKTEHVRAKQASPTDTNLKYKTETFPKFIPSPPDTLVQQCIFTANIPGERHLRLTDSS